MIEEEEEREAGEGGDREEEEMHMVRWGPRGARFLFFFFLLRLSLDSFNTSNSPSGLGCSASTVSCLLGLPPDEERGLQR